MDTSSKEYVEWMAKVWKANDERNKYIEKKRLHWQLMDELACIDEGEYA
jgi:hypothetical protein